MPKHSLRSTRHKVPLVSTVVVGLLVLILAGLSLVFLDKSASLNDNDATETIAAKPQSAKVIEVDDELIPLHREPPPPPPPAPVVAPPVAPVVDPAAPAPAAAAPQATAAPKPAPAPAPAPRSTASIDPYRGFGIGWTSTTTPFGTPWTSRLRST